MVRFITGLNRPTVFTYFWLQYAIVILWLTPPLPADDHAAFRVKADDHGSTEHRYQIKRHTPTVKKPVLEPYEVLSGERWLRTYPAPTFLVQRTDWASAFCFPFSSIPRAPPIVPV
jgi:hypothetical protein